LIRAAARRALLPVAIIVGAVFVVAAVAVLAGSHVQRALALGLYAVGAFMAIVGFALGSRGLFRSVDRQRPETDGGISVLWETTEAAALLIVVGLVLLIAGTAVDPHARLV
jgi:hypothetical protein